LGNTKPQAVAADITSTITRVGPDSPLPAAAVPLRLRLGLAVDPAGGPTEPGKLVSVRFARPVAGRVGTEALLALEAGAAAMLESSRARLAPRAGLHYAGGVEGAGQRIRRARLRASG
jgi:hypothetical protein